MLSILAEKIHDNRFLRLLRNMLQAGYLEDWVWNATLSGAPQGGCASPILSNIYLHRLDVFVETVLIPEYTRGGGGSRNPAYLKEANTLARARRAGDPAEARKARDRMRSLPSVDPTIPASGDCGMCATAMTTCSGSPDRKPKPRRWTNCLTNTEISRTASTNCPSPGRWSMRITADATVCISAGMCALTAPEAVRLCPSGALGIR
ncbi:hypothetical protein [Nonomuraea mesophila]|uniref:hypothetical protein n=1 Tax=Nonomuraea mesophila TaxID=2530382 RepID=UPI001C6FD9D5|nr:hypothetical protein [Nonomuraea mesophila]